MLQTTLGLIAFLFPLAYSPGPGNLFFAATGARFGFRATIPANIGYHVATWLVTAMIGLGFAAALDRMPQAVAALKVIGALYVLKLAWNLFRAGTLGAVHEARPAGWVDGAVLLLVNPKAYIIIALMFTQFQAEPGLAALPWVLLIATVFTLNNMVAFSVYTLLGDRIAGLFRTPEAAGALNAVFAAVLAGVAVWMLL